MNRMANKYVEGSGDSDRYDEDIERLDALISNNDMGKIEALASQLSLKSDQQVRRDNGAMGRNNISDWNQNDLKFGLVSQNSRVNDNRKQVTRLSSYDGPTTDHQPHDDQSRNGYDFQQSDGLQEAGGNGDTQEVDSMTLCPICAQMFTDPKMLPCLHTFCLICLQQTTASSAVHSPVDTNVPPTSAGDNDGVSCPICLRLFRVPPGGLIALPTNRLFARITETRRSESVDSTSRNTTSTASDEPEILYCALCEDPPPAVYQCIDCDGDPLCEDCASAHRKQRLSKGHQLVELESAAASGRCGLLCQVHESHPIEAYCVKCLSPVCRLCRHPQPGSASTGPAALQVPQCTHDECVDPGAMAQSSRMQLAKDIESVGHIAEALQKLLASITTQRLAFITQINEVDGQINQAADAVHAIVDQHRQKLLDENNEIRSNTLRELDKLADDIVVDCLQVDGLRQLSCQLLTCGDDNDIALLYGKLSAQRHHLRNVQARHDVSVCGIKFRSAVTSLKSDHSNILGKLVLLDVDSSDPYVTTPTVLHTFAGSKTIAGVTVLGKELYVLRDQVSNVEVYDAVAPWTGLRRLTIPGLRWPSDIAACSANNKIYIADMFGYVYIFEPAGTTFSKFQVDGEPQGLFVSSTTVYVTCCTSRTVKEFTLDGNSCLRTVRFQTDIQRPYHTVPMLEPGRYIVCHGQESGKLHRVCVVDTSGKVMYCYGNANGSGSGRLDCPSHVSIDKYGYVLVVDRNNDRVMLLSPNLVHVRDLINRSQFGLKQPRRMCLDPSSGMLYLGLITGRVAVLRLINV